jgi:hypothetical protein
MSQQSTVDAFETGSATKSKKKGKNFIAKRGKVALLQFSSCDSEAFSMPLLPLLVLEVESGIKFHLH